MKRLLFLLSVLVACGVFCVGCIEASQEPVDYDAVVVTRNNGTAVVDGWAITLTRAQIALGPFYFCAASSGSSTLCASSIGEVTRVSVVDALASAPASLGKVHGFTGNVQSVSYDFGISWFVTQSEATPAPSLPGGHSMRLEGEATKGTQRVVFTADVDVVPQYQGQNAISTAPAIANVQSSATRLEVVVDPASWLKQLDFDALATAVAATGGAPFAIEPGSEQHSAVLVGLKNLAPPELRWVAAP
jgi:hypothetical protein